MRWSSKRALAGTAVFAALAGGGGAAYAATQDDGSEDGDRPQAVLPDVAERLGVTEGELRAAFQAEALERLDAAVAEGRIDEAGAARIRERIEEGRPIFGPPHGRAHDGPPGHFRGAGLETAAAYLGVETEELVGELREGKTLAQVAEEQGKSLEGLEEALVAAARERIHEFVTEGPRGPRR